MMHVIHFPDRPRSHRPHDDSPLHRLHAARLRLLSALEDADEAALGGDSAERDRLISAVRAEFDALKGIAA